MTSRTPLIIFLILLLGSFANANAQEVILSCDTNLRWGFIGSLSETGYIILEGQGRTKQEINTAALTEFSSPDVRGNVRRLKSKKVTLTCGPFSIIFSSGWFNSNPLGEMGEPEFSVFEILLNGKLMLGPIALGACSSSGLVWNRCPDDWANSVILNWNEMNNKGFFELKRTYDERRQWP